MKCMDEFVPRTGDVAVDSGPQLFGTRDRFCRRKFSHGLAWRRMSWFGDDSNTLHSLCTLFLL